jgi:nitroreductase
VSHRAETDHPVQDLVAERWSPYVFADRPVAEETLRSLFEAARWAPSSYNEQPWRYLVARREQPEAFERMLSCLVEGNQAWARFVPVLALGVVARTFERNGKPNKAAEHDLGLAAGNLLAEATARGLHVHQMIGILPDRARDLYAIPQDFDALTALAIGHHGERPEAPDTLRERDAGARTRRPLPAFVFEGRFGRAARWTGGDPDAG